MNLAPRTVRRGPIAVVALLAFLLAVPSLPAMAGRLPGFSSVASASPSSVSTASIYAGSFAARAGYQDWYARSVDNATPSVGPQLVVVTFRPSDPSLFIPPAQGSPPLTVSQVGDRYGLSPAAYASAEAYFESRGLAIVHAGADRLSLTVGGSAPDVGRAFGTQLESGTYSGRVVSFPASVPSLPAALESSVASITGLSSGFVTFSLPAGLPMTPSRDRFHPSVGSGDLMTPAIARKVYDLSPLYNVSGSSHYAGGQGIALILWGWGYDPNDLAAFFSNNYPAGFPPPTIQFHPVDGAPAPSSNAVNDPSKAPQELTLDMEWAGSMAPGASLHAVYAPDGPKANNYSPSDQTITDALHEAVTGITGVSVISMSFGTPEGASQGLATAWATDLATATQEGITLLAATGDLGGDAGASCSGGPLVDFPATSPDVIGVGGTAPTLARNLLGQVTGLSSEPAWDGSAGGFSTLVPAPSWQEVGSAAVPISANGHRGLPDVSASAAYNFLHYAGSDGIAAGTSFATPLWAGLVAEMDSLYGAKLGLLTPRLYAVGANQERGSAPVGIADVVGGSTCIGTAAAGWDTESGWGSPRALLLYEDLTATFVNLAISATPSPVAPGGTVTVTAQLSNRTSGAPIPGVPVTVSFQASDPNGPCAGIWGSQSIASNATGFVSLAVTVPACFFGAHGDAIVSVTSNGYYGANSSTVDVNLLGLVPALAGIEQFPLNVVAFGLIMTVAIVVGYVLGATRAAPPPRPRRRVPATSRAATGPTAPGPSPASSLPSQPPSPPATGPPPGASTNPLALDGEVASDPSLGGGSPQKT